MTEYNYSEFSAAEYNLDAFKGPQVGQKAPPLDVLNLKGERKVLLDFNEDFLVLEIGSITCPLFQSRRNGMEKAQKNYPNVKFAILYVREAHPGEGVPAHKSLEDKLSCARRFKNEDGETRDIYTDNFEGAVHQAYGGYPNAVFIINKNGCIVYFSDWNNAASTAQALKRLTSGQPANVKSYFRPARPDIAFKTLHRGGHGSAGDFVKSLPTLIWKNLLRRNILLLFNQHHKIMPDQEC